MIRLLVVLAAGCLVGYSAEWLTRGGDAQRSGWQRREKHLNMETVKGLKLLWKKQLAGGTAAATALTSPVMLGNIITHRGIKELVFVADVSDNFYAVDTDLGRVFWKRHFDVALDARPSCAPGLTAAPVITYVRTNEEDDWSTPLRPIYILASDGSLHTVRPSDGEEAGPPAPFVPANSIAGDLNLVSNILYTTVGGDCGGTPHGVWSIRVGSGAAKPYHFAADVKPGVSVGSGGTLYSNTGSSLLALTADALTVKTRFNAGSPFGSPPLVFRTGGHDVLVIVDPQRITAIHTQQKTRITRDGNDFTGVLATSEDASGRRLIYAGTSRSIQAFDGSLSPLWTANQTTRPVSLAVVAGMVFAVGGDGAHITLSVVEASTGKELYTGGDISSNALPGPLAIANGHICFGSSDGTLYCFGLPMEI